MYSSTSTEQVYKAESDAGNEKNPFHHRTSGSIAKVRVATLNDVTCEVRIAAKPNV